MADPDASHQEKAITRVEFEAVLQRLADVEKQLVAHLEDAGEQVEAILKELRARNLSDEKAREHLQVFFMRTERDMGLFFKEVLDKIGRTSEVGA